MLHSQISAPPLQCISKAPQRIEIWLLLLPLPALLLPSILLLLLSSTLLLQWRDLPLLCCPSSTQLSLLRLL
jgi:hypothetical protein